MLLALCCCGAPAGSAQNQASSDGHAHVASREQAPAYRLAGDTLARAIKVSRIRAVLHFVSAGWGMAATLVLLMLRVPAKFRDWAVAASRNRWIQCLIFLPLMLLTLTLTALPIGLYRQHVDRLYGLSVQGWGSWLWDQAKEFLIFAAILYVPVMLLVFLLRRYPRRWWLWFWAASVPFSVFVLFVSPVLIDPLMNKFEPLGRADASLVTQLEKVVKHGGLTVPPNRMFLMKASAKTTELNAYVTGVGASKRVVVWDTSVAKATPDEILFIFGHEMGHYVLHHIWLGIAFGCVTTFIGLWMLHHAMNWLIGRFGRIWRISSTSDWAALAVLLLAASVLSFLFEPVASAFSRELEHQADIYGQEAVHGIVHDPQQVGRDAFQVLGETSLVDPKPNAFVEFWTGDHPSIASRAEFAKSYDPWRPGQRPKYFAK